MIIGLLIGTGLTLLAFAGIFSVETRKEAKRFTKQLKGDWV